MEKKRHRVPAAVFTGMILLSVVALAQEQKPKNLLVAFFLIGDTHILANKTEPAKVDARSASYSSRLVDALNNLQGAEIPKFAGGGQVASLRGVIHAGDCIDTGDQPNL